MTDTKCSKDRPEEDVDLRKAFKVLLKRSTLIILITLLFTLASGLISIYLVKPVYQAETLLMVTVASDKLQDVANLQEAQNNQNIGSANTPVLTMKTYLGQLKSEIVMKRVITSLNLSDQTIASLNQIVDASVVADSNLIEVKVNDTDPFMAASIANAVSDEYLGLIKELMFSSVVVISPANIPTAPVKPNVKLNIAIAFILGIMLSVLLAFFLEYMDNTLKTAEDINRELDLTLLGLIPVRTNSNTKQSRYGGSI